MIKSEIYCSKCKRKIEDGEEAYFKLRYPKKKGFTEIKAYLSNESRTICTNCCDC
ncbi:Fe3+ hydroxamate ABC transporter substrate-binding protein [Radiobacillus deserti]|uniref:Fe3+ hydroxamate ABC transporter substrate-binding protein n=1 Tax=Radiobacillus deserti TaxID=2594883 RepID=A0A516KKP9_9BACI|nr:Fe3+ hydroxamate ABC transporter substrate-binding protein [Radiobacillus deserti]